MKRHQLTSPILATVLATALVAGCSSINLRTHSPSSAAEAVSLAAEESDQQLAQQYLLRSARAFQQQGDHRAARRILRSDALATPLPALQPELDLLSMVSAEALADQGWARQLVVSRARDAFSQYADDEAVRAASLQASLYRQLDRPADAALTLMALVDSGLVDNTIPWHNRIWRALKQTSDQTLANLSQQASNYNAQGWLELAALLRSDGDDINLDRQGRRIRDWQYNWTGHPAAANLPDELRLIASLAQQRPERIALALPLSGTYANAGQAIRDGFLSAFYLDEHRGDADSDIRVIDTHDLDAKGLLAALKEAEPDLIVGPLRKELLTELSQLAPFPVPVLALNYLPDSLQAPEDLYQFGLAAEDEARQIADRLKQDGLGRALVLVPQGDWGSRFEQALQQALSEDEGAVLDVVHYADSDNLRELTANLLGISVSRERAIDVERTIGRNIEFEPRRRQDAEAIVLVAQPMIARQFKPMFAFYYAGDLPVYAPSIVYEGNPDPSRDRDLNAIQLTDLPWVLAPDNPFRNATQAAFSNLGGQLGRLFAMGADSYQLTNRLPLLKQMADASLAGQTGQLSMDRQGRVHRQQLWAQFQQGQPVLATDAGEDEEHEENEAKQDAEPIN
ncbi:MAG: penicillin-binding protein activator [Pseudomonadales bacterium]|nr:penicillin-binding protein activator [Pseudomonadales bacterium]